MQKWQEFLESLETKGGNILVLGFVSLFIIAFVVHLEYRPQVGVEIRTFALGQAALFTGALLNALSPKDRNRNGNGNGNGKPPEPPKP